MTDQHDLNRDPQHSMPRPDEAIPTPQAEDAIGAPAAPTQSVETPRRTGGLRWGIALLAVALIIGATAATLFLLSGSSTPSTVSGYVPDGSFAYAEARLDLPGDQRQHLANFLSHFPGFDDQAIFDQKVDEALDRIVSDSTAGEELYTRDLKPWLGDSIALVGTRVPTDATGKDVGILGILATKDAAAARAWVDRTSRLADKRTETHAGVEITIGRPAESLSSGPEGAYAVVENVLLAGDLTSVKAAIDTKGASAFGASERYRTARASVPGDQAGFVFVDVRSALDRIASSAAFGGIPIDQFAKAPDWMAGGLRFESDAIVVQSAMPPVEGNPAASDRLSELAPRLPADTIVALEGRAIGEYIKAFIANLKASEQTRESVEQLEQQAALLGGLDSFISWIGDGTFALAGSGTDYRGGIVVKVTDDGALQTKLLSLRNLIALAGGGSGVTLSDAPYGDGTITTIDLGDLGQMPLGLPGASVTPAEPGQKLTIAYTHQAGLFVLGVGIDDAFVKSVVDTTPGASLADQPGYRTAFDRIGKENTGQAWVDLRALVAAAPSWVPEADRATFEREYLPYLRPFAALAANGQAGDPIRSRSILTVK